MPEMPIVGQPPMPDDLPKPPSKPLPIPRMTDDPQLAPKPRPAQPVPPKTQPAPPPRAVEAKPAPKPTPPPATKPTTPNTLPPINPGPTVAPAVIEPGGLEPHPSLSATLIPVRHGTVGSPNLTLSRDYHFLDFFGVGLLGDDANAVLPGEGPAPDQSFVQAEYLLWWVRSANVPVLASTATGQMFGYLGMPGTDVLLGPGSFGTTSRNGFRTRAGTWLGDSGLGVDGGFFFLGRQSTRFEINSDRFPTIARPIFAPNPGIAGEFAELVAFPGLSTGALRVDTNSYLWGADVNLRGCVCRTCDARAEWFVGYRHLNLREDVTITEFITAGANAPDPAGTSIRVQDRFATHNTFHGGQIGWAAGRKYGRFDVDTRVSVALGVTHQVLDIAGFQERTRPGQPRETFTGGLLAAGPNLGKFTRDRFSVVPEATLNVGYWVTPGFRAYVGYNYLFWSNVLRPGEQIDRTVDLTFVPNAPRVPFGQNRPLPAFKQADLWAQGLQFGLEARW
jgi:hypothetical protein